MLQSLPLFVPTHPMENLASDILSPADPGIHPQKRHKKHKKKVKRFVQRCRERIRNARLLRFELSMGQEFFRRRKA